MNSQAGKGDKIRQGANLKAYWDNYDNIFRKKENDNVVFYSDDKGHIYKWPDDFMMDSVDDYIKIHKLKIVHPKKYDE